jgi:hypothetical protein
VHLRDGPEPVIKAKHRLNTINRGLEIQPLFTINKVAFPGFQRRETAEKHQHEKTTHWRHINESAGNRLFSASQ